MRSVIVACSQYQQFTLAALAIGISCQGRRVSLHVGAAEWALLPAITHHESLVILVVNATTPRALATT